MRIIPQSSSYPLKWFIWDFFFFFPLMTRVFVFTQAVAPANRAKTHIFSINACLKVRKVLAFRKVTKIQ